MNRSIQFLSLLSLITLTACSSLMGGLRRDLDDSQFEEAPTAGGRFSERGLLSENELGEEEDSGSADYSVGHIDRSPASMARETGEESASEGESRFSSTDGDRPPQIRRKYRNGTRATRADFVDDANLNEGSLWASDGQTNYYFTKNKIRGVGDLVSVGVEEPLLKDIGRELMRNLSSQEREQELTLAQERLRRAAMGLPEENAKPTDQIAQTASAPERTPATAEPTARTPVVVPEATLADINILKSVDIKAGDPIMAEIVERYPNGNYRIRGTRRIAYRIGRSKLINFTAIAKGADITEDDQIQSGKLYEYRIEEILD